MQLFFILSVFFFFFLFLIILKFILFLYTQINTGESKGEKVVAFFFRHKKKLINK